MRAREIVQVERVSGMMEVNWNKRVSTNRLLLRQFREEDLGAYSKIMGDYMVGKWLPKGDGYTREEAERSLRNILEHWDRYGFGIWAVVNKKKEILLGRCGLNWITETSEVEVDFVLAKNHWGRGYATEAAKAALTYGFEVLKLDRIIALTKPENTASRRVIEKIGMRYTKNAEYWGVTCAYYEISKTEHARMPARNKLG